MAERSVTVQFEIVYDPKTVTARKVVKEFDNMIDQMLAGGESWADEFRSDEEGIPGVSRLRVVPKRRVLR